jgi:hypothetical protein
VEGALGFSIKHIVHQTWLDVDQQGVGNGGRDRGMMDMVITSANAARPSCRPSSFAPLSCSYSRYAVIARR